MYCVFGLLERRYTGCPLAPLSEMFWKVEVALARNCADVDAPIVSVPVVLAEFAKMMDCVLLPLPLVLVMVRFLNAEVPTIVPERLCVLLPLRVVVPVPAVKVPELL